MGPTDPRFESPGYHSGYLPTPSSFPSSRYAPTPSPLCTKPKPFARTPPLYGRLPLPPLISSAHKLLNYKSKRPARSQVSQLASYAFTLPPTSKTSAPLTCNPTLVITLVFTRCIQYLGIYTLLPRPALGAKGYTQWSRSRSRNSPPLPP